MLWIITIGAVVLTTEIAFTGTFVAVLNGTVSTVGHEAFGISKELTLEDVANIKKSPITLATSGEFPSGNAMPAFC